MTTDTAPFDRALVAAYNAAVRLAPPRTMPAPTPAPESAQPLRRIHRRSGKRVA